jgi:hypothetical protein
MSHRSHNQAQARTRCPTHDGSSQAIRDALVRAGEPLSVYKLHLATGIEVEKIKSAVSQMVGRTGSIVSMPGPKGTVYALYGQYRKARETQPSGSGCVAEYREHPQFRELKRDPFEHMKLAMATRR